VNRWSKDELSKIGKADHLYVAPFREEGVTYGTPTWIWSVTVEDAIYVRAYSGQNSSWFQAALRQKAGRITAAGMIKEVTFERVDGAMAAPRKEAKFSSSPGSVSTRPHSALPVLPLR
jgi:hypothetical protein